MNNFDSNCGGWVKTNSRYCNLLLTRMWLLGIVIFKNQIKFSIINITLYNTSALLSVQGKNVTKRNSFCLRKEDSLSKILRKEEGGGRGLYLIFDYWQQSV